MIIRFALCLALLLGLTTCGSTPKQDVVIIVLDTFRADHLGLEQTTPFIDQWSQQTQAFPQARSFSGNTNIAMAALWTGKKPDLTGVLTQVTPLPQKETTLAETYQAAGYETIGISANPVLAAKKGYAQGFDSYTCALFNGDQVLEKLEEALRHRKSNKPLFLYLHFMDTHFPYNPGPYFELFDPAPGEPFTYFQDVQSGTISIETMLFQPTLSQTDQARGKAYYRASVRQVDQYLKETHDLLGPIWKKARVVLTADHGEHLGEHGYHFGHSLLTYQQDLHVPLLIQIPGTPGKVHETVVSHGQLHREMSGWIEADPGRQSMWHSAEEATVHGAWGHPNLGQFKKNPFHALSGLESAWRSYEYEGEKLIVIPEPGGQFAIQFYNLKDDPLEQNNLGKQGLEQSVHKRPLLLGNQNQNRENQGVVDVGPEDEELLKSLGYISNNRKP